MDGPRITAISRYLFPVAPPLPVEPFHPRPGGNLARASVMAETEQLQAPPSLVISPNLQALLEFDNRLRTPSESHGPPAKEQLGQCPSWREQAVPTVSLPPPRRKKGVVAGVPVSPKTASESRSMAPRTNTFPGADELPILGEIEFARLEDVVEGESRSTNPYLNSPPSPPRHFYHRSDYEELEGIAQHQPTPCYTLDKPRSMRQWPDRQRSFSGPSPVEHRGGQLASRRYFTSLVRNVGSRPKEKGATWT